MAKQHHNLESVNRFKRESIVKLLVLILISLSFCGCRRYFGPVFQTPGTIFQQRTIAVQHDPFPSDVFGPKIEGGRPLGYTKGLAEPAASQFGISGR